MFEFSWTIPFLTFLIGYVGGSVMTAAFAFRRHLNKDEKSTGNDGLHALECRVRGFKISANSSTWSPENLAGDTII